MTIHHLQLIQQDQINLRLASDDSSTSSEAEMKTNTPLKGKPDHAVIRQGEKSVRFTEDNDYFEIQHVEDMEEEEIAKTWYTRRDYSSIRAAYSVTVRIMTTSTQCLDESVEHCTRGLEYRTPEGSQKRQANKWNAIEAVLDEQRRQREECINDDITISSVYKSVSFQCQKEALERGLADAEAASCAEKPSPKKISPRRMSRTLMRDPSARRRAVLEDLQKMLTGSNVVSVRN